MTARGTAGVGTGGGETLAGLHGSIVALATPFRGSQLDEDALGRMVARQVAAGTVGLVACGSTGEAPALSGDEAARVVACVVAAADGRVPVIAGCTAGSTDAAVELATRAARAGADALLLAAPPYVRPTQAGIAAHVRAVAHAAGRPVMLYDVPGRTGTPIADATIAKLFAAELIFAVKDATADLSRPPRLRALCGTALAQFTGDDATAAAHRAMGGAGCVSVTANVAPALCAALHRSWEAGDLAGFARLRDLLDPLHAALFAESNPIPLKAALAELALCADALRLPLTRAEAATRERLAAVLEVVMPAEERAIPRTLRAVAM
jgi:4-hydroxy-tetrahydrodipicolinate synthase